MNTKIRLSNMDGSTRKICIDGKLYIIKPDVETPTVGSSKDMQESGRLMKKIPSNIEGRQSERTEHYKRFELVLHEFG
jgi:hypothetical protein